MACCRVLYNRGQKHDGPNQRVMESMAVGRPLLTDFDALDGMSELLFEPGSDCLFYEDFKQLEDRLRGLLQNEEVRNLVGQSGRLEVEAKHRIKHRAQQILEVVCS